MFSIMQGMEYLHRSALKYHGRLKTSNVLIDSRWTIKITDWGLTQFRNSLKDMEDDDVCSGRPNILTCDQEM